MGQINIYRANDELLTSLSILLTASTQQDGERARAYSHLLQKTDMIRHNLIREPWVEVVI